MCSMRQRYATINGGATPCNISVLGGVRDSQIKTATTAGQAATPVATTTAPNAARYVRGDHFLGGAPQQLMDHIAGQLVLPSLVYDDTLPVAISRHRERV